MSSKLITVLGGTGFLGRHIVTTLSEAGHRVRVAARHAEDKDFSHLRTAPEAVNADIRDKASLSRALADADAVVNAVSLYAEKGGLDFETIHVRGAERVARCARENGADTLLHISGIGVDTESPSPYVRARARGEHGVRRAFPEAVVLRPSVLFGPDDDFLSTLDLVSRLPVIPLFGNGGTRLQPVHAADVAAAARICIGRTGLEERVYELGGDEIRTYREILQALLEFRDRRRLLVPFPFALWHLMAGAFKVLPNPPLTRDQIWLMQEDNVVSVEYPGFPELGYKPVSITRSLEQALGNRAFNQSAPHDPGR